MKSEKNTAFISYAREDVQHARRLYRELNGVGVEVWFDEESLLPGQHWKTEIKRAIRNKRYFIAILSSKSVNKRGIVQTEILEALEILKEFPPDSVYIIPVRINLCQPVHEKLSDLQWVDMFPKWNRGFEKICQSMGISKELVMRFELIKMTPDDKPRPLIPVQILNPANGKSFRTFALIDTGVDQTVIPAEFAKILDMVVDETTSRRKIQTANGIQTVTSFNIILELFNTEGETLHSSDEFEIINIEGLNTVLIGMDFLSKFELKIDYPNNLLSLK